MTALATLPLVHRFFFALTFDELTAHRLRAFAEDEFGARGLQSPDRLHMALAITDNLDAPYQSLVGALRLAGNAVAAAPFAMILNQLSGCGSAITLHPDHGRQPLRALQSQIAGAMARQRFSSGESGYASPHVTLAHRTGTTFRRPVAGFHVKVTQFALIHSFVGLSRQETLGHWALKPQDDAAVPAQYSLF